MRTLAGAITHVGAKRTVNEDGFIADQYRGLFAVIDGANTALLGRAAIDRLKSMLSDNILSHQTATPEDLASAVGETSAQLFRLSEINADYRGVSASVSLFRYIDKTAHIAHVGDTKAFLFRDGELKKLTTEHTLGQKLMSAGELSQTEARTFPHRHVLIRALGASSKLDVDTFALSLQPNDVILLASDGLTAVMSEPELQEELAAHQPSQAASRLIKQANQRAVDDNVTVVIVRFAPP